MKSVKRIISYILVLTLLAGGFSTIFASPLTAMAAKKTTGTETEAETETGEEAPSILYQTHVQSIGWQGYVKDGETAGTEGYSYRLEAIRIKLQSKIKGSVKYKVHVQQDGWQDYVKNNRISGTSGRSLRLEAICIKLTGDIAKQYDVWYRVHCQSYGWMDWQVNGGMAGTSGESKRLEGIQIKLVKKDVLKTASVKYKTHVQSDGWQDFVSDGGVSGTEGRSLRLEGIVVDLDTNYSGGIQYCTHVQDYGWLNYVTGNNMSGTTGQSKRLEAIRIKLYGEVAEHYNVYYRVHAETYGWLDWAKNGTLSGTAGLSKRLEAIEIVLVKKGQKAPGPTARPYVTKKVLAEEEKKRQEEEQKKKEEEEQALDNLSLKKKINAVTLHPMLTNDPAMDKKVASILKKITKPSMTTYQKVQAIYTWIIANTNYYYDDAAGSWGNTPVNYAMTTDKALVSQAYTVIFYGYGTCINYAAAFVVMSRAIGLESYRVDGGWGYSSHYWAMVKLGTKYYHVDPQIEDDGWDESSAIPCPYSYFFRTQKFLDNNGYWYRKEAFQDAVSGFNNFKVQ